MRIKRAIFRELLSPFGKDLYDFVNTYGIPAGYFSRVLDMSQVDYNNKLKGKKDDFTTEQKNIIAAEIERLQDIFSGIEEDIKDIYVRKR